MPSLFFLLQKEVLHTPDVSRFTIWKEGVFFGVGEQDVLITHSIDRKRYQIHIRVRYPNSQVCSAGMMLSVCQILEGILRTSFPHLLYNISRLVPCVHCINLRVLTGNIFLFQYDECFRAVTEGKPFLFCNHIESSTRCVRVDTLAPDLGFADIPQIPEDKFTVTRLLGQGGFGCVYLGLLDGKKAIAIKELIADNNSERDQVEAFGEFLREAYMMSFLQHPNLVSLFGVCLSKPPRLLMEFVPCGDLKQLITSQNGVPLEPWLITQIAYDVAVGMNHLHSISPPIIHRDLRSPNIFVRSPSLLSFMN